MYRIDPGAIILCLAEIKKEPLSLSQLCDLIIGITVTHYQRRFSFLQIEIIIEIHNWSKWREQLIMGIQPCDTSATQSHLRENHQRRSKKTVKSQWSRIPVDRVFSLAMAREMHLGIMNNIVVLRPAQ